MEPQETKLSEKTQLSIPSAIIVAGLLIGGGLFFGLKSSASPATVQKEVAQKVEEPTMNLGAVNPITSSDHIRGDIDAPVKIIEYSDTECPFCKRFHTTMKQAIDEYGKDGKVAWVYRHYPLDQLHSKARKEAEATECAAEIGGNDKFWEYLDRLMEVTPSNNGLDSAELPKIAEYVGLDTTKFNECLSSGKYADKIQKHIDNAVATGGQGTPWTIVTGKNNKKYPISGAQSYESVKAVIEQALKGK